MGLFGISGWLRAVHAGLYFDSMACFHWAKVYELSLPASHLKQGQYCTLETIDNILELFSSFLCQVRVLIKVSSL